MARMVDRHVSRRTEDSVIFVVLVLTLLFLAFMTSVPIWFSGFVRGLTG